VCVNEARGTGELWTHVGLTALLLIQFRNGSAHNIRL